MKTLLAFFISALSLTAVAQAPKCEDNFKVFEGRYLAKNYDDAYAVMADLRVKCPKVSENLYAYGEQILLYKIEAATLPEEKKPFIDDLVALYNEQSANYPLSGAEVKKAQLQFDNKLIAGDVAYKAFDAAFNKNRRSFTDYNSLLTYFNLFFEQYKGSKGITDDQYFEKYGDISSQVSLAKVKMAEKRDAIVKKQETSMITDLERQFVADAEPNLDALENVAEIIRRQSKDYISCEKLEAFYDKGYEGHKTDAVWLESMVDAFYGKKCFRSALLQKGALAVHAIKPTKETAYRLGVIAAKKGDKKEAVKYFEQAAVLEPDPVKKAAVFYDIATAAQNTDKAISKQYLLKTVELNPKKGDAYLLLAELYTSVTANDECKLTDFDRKVINFLAIDTAKKAGVADPNLKSSADLIIKRYSKNLPNKAEAKAIGKKKGDKVAFGCWINETVTLPSL